MVHLVVLMELLRWHLRSRVLHPLPLGACQGVGLDPAHKGPGTGPGSGPEVVHIWTPSVPAPELLLEICPVSHTLVVGPEHGSRSTP